MAAVELPIKVRSIKGANALQRGGTEHSPSVCERLA
jgi:hypothetical protein